MVRKARRRFAADLLLRPIPLVAVVVLLANDRVFKRHWPGVVTGKLSDAAGVVLLPLVVMAANELYRQARHRSPIVTTRFALASVGVVAVGFAAVKVFPSVAHLFAGLVGVLRAPFDGGYHSVEVTHDVTDLIVLPSACLAAFEALAVSR